MRPDADRFRLREDSASPSSSRTVGHATISVGTKNARAMSKLRKAASKLKQMLSANKQAGASVEGLINDRDFSATMKRAEFEELFRLAEKTPHCGYVQNSSPVSVAYKGFALRDHFVDPC